MDAPNNTQNNVPQLIDINKLTPQAKEQAQQLAVNVDIKDSQSILQYGVQAQSNISAFSDTILTQVKTKDAGYIGDSLMNLGQSVRELKIDKIGGGGFFSRVPLLGNFVNSVKRFINRYEKVSTQIERIVDELDKARMQLIKDITMLDTLYQKNHEYLADLDLYIAAGQLKLNRVYAEELPEIEKTVAATADPADAQKLHDYKQMVHRFEKKLHDLKLSRTISIQTAPQIRLIQNNDQLLVEKIQSSILNTIPLWKNQVVIAISIFRQNKALALQKEITKTTNELLTKNSEMLKAGSIETAKENERGIVEIETLKKVNNDLITTIEETLAIQKEGKVKRAEAEVELVKLENELKTKLNAVKNA
ncbi:Uncharacterized conserved protein YaaN involved in tellurite resistance [Saccharicrinis carchari]|uniref:Uncharacterized conserved protein YaaN involved in tellurite resistance n=1 Tax=Saccharicrinis carchari TaxID=1168039 RepID=A0A521BE75_SACCC|nr:toxic anion resistance protein [Saccharicrinis carchari]SMO45407.1 Uncharacterized conserved protein YaaN involved in tellurite resistance [Saccharicrinis carchari]